MADSSRYEETDCPKTYRKIEEELENAYVAAGKVPEEINISVFDSILQERGVPIHSYQWENLPETYIERMELEPVDDFGRKYLRKIGQIDYRETGRTLHQRGLDALMERRLEGEGIMEFDVAVREFFLGDDNYVPPKEPGIELPNHRKHETGALTDADFIGINQDSGRILVTEVKTSNEPFDKVGGENVDRWERQLGDIKNRIMDIIQERDLEFREERIETEKRLVPELLPQNPLPANYSGQLYTANEELNPETVELLEGISQELKIDGMRPLEKRREA